MMRLEESDGAGRRKHRGKSQFFLFLLHPLVPARVEAALLLGWLCSALLDMEEKEGPHSSAPAPEHHPALRETFPSPKALQVQ